MLSLFFFIDRLCRLLSIFRPGQDAKLIVFFFFFSKLIKKNIKKKNKKKNKQCYHCFFIVRLCRLISIFRFFLLKNKGKTYRSTPRFGETYTTVTALCSFFDLFSKSTALYSGRNFFQIRDSAVVLVPD